jgi:hypothetical protein
MLSIAHNEYHHHHHTIDVIKMGEAKGKVVSELNKVPQH